MDEDDVLDFGEEEDDQADIISLGGSDRGAPEHLEAVAATASTSSGSLGARISSTKHRSPTKSPERGGRTQPHGTDDVLGRNPSRLERPQAGSSAPPPAKAEAPVLPQPKPQERASYMPPDRSLASRMSAPKASRPGSRRIGVDSYRPESAKSAEPQRSESRGASYSSNVQFGPRRDAPPAERSESLADRLREPPPRSDREGRRSRPETSRYDSSDPYARTDPHVDFERDSREHLRGVPRHDSRPRRYDQHESDVSGRGGRSGIDSYRPHGVDDVRPLPRDQPPSRDAGYASRRRDAGNEARPPRRAAEDYDAPRGRLVSEGLDDRFPKPTDDRKSLRDDRLAARASDDRFPPRSTDRSRPASAAPPPADVRELGRSNGRRRDDSPRSRRKPSPRHDASVNGYGPSAGRTPGDLSPGARADDVPALGPKRRRDAGRQDELPASSRASSAIHPDRLARLAPLEDINRARHSRDRDRDAATDDRSGRHRDDPVASRPGGYLDKNSAQHRNEHPYDRRPSDAAGTLAEASRRIDDHPTLALSKRTSANYSASKTQDARTSWDRDGRRGRETRDEMSPRDRDCSPDSDRPRRPTPLERAAPRAKSPQSREASRTRSPTAQPAAASRRAASPSLARDPPPHMWHSSRSESRHADSSADGKGRSLRADSIPIGPRADMHGSRRSQFDRPPQNSQEAQYSIQGSRFATQTTKKGPMGWSTPADSGWGSRAKQVAAQPFATTLAPAPESVALTAIESNEVGAASDSTHQKSVANDQSAMQIATEEASRDVSTDRSEQEVAESLVPHDYSAMTVELYRAVTAPPVDGDNASAIEQGEVVDALDPSDVRISEGDAAAPQGLTDSAITDQAEPERLQALRQASLAAQSSTPSQPYSPRLEISPPPNEVVPERSSPTRQPSPPVPADAAEQSDDDDVAMVEVTTKEDLALADEAMRPTTDVEVVDRALSSLNDGRKRRQSKDRREVLGESAISAAYTSLVDRIGPVPAEEAARLPAKKKRRVGGLTGDVEAPALANSHSASPAKSPVTASTDPVVSEGTAPDKPPAALPTGPKALRVRGSERVGDARPVSAEGSSAIPTAPRSLSDRMRGNAPTGPSKGGQVSPSGSASPQRGTSSVSASLGDRIRGSAPQAGDASLAYRMKGGKSGGHRGGGPGGGPNSGRGGGPAWKGRRNRS